MMTLTKARICDYTQMKTSDYMFACSVQKKQVVLAFPLAFQEYKIVDAHVNMEERKEETKAHNENGWKVDFIL